MERLPKNYQLVWELVRDAGPNVHLTTNELFALAKKRRPAIGFTTVYRGIQRLRELGLIEELIVPGTDAAVYEPSGPSHAHFRCTRCGRVADVEYALEPDVLAALEERSGTRIETASITLHGFCAACR